MPKVHLIFVRVVVVIIVVVLAARRDKSLFLSRYIDR